MKTSIILGSILLLLFAGAAFSQAIWLEKARIDVSFPFMVGGSALPPGTYLISENSSTHQLRISNIENSSAAYASHQDVDISNNLEGSVGKAKAVFVRDADGRHVLHQVLIPGDYHGNDLRHKKGISEPH